MWIDTSAMVNWNKPRISVCWGSCWILSGGAGVGGLPS